MRVGDCTPCVGAGCLRDASARITIEVVGLAFSALPAAELSDLCSSYAKDIASTCGVDDSAVVDLQGKKATVTISEDGSISAFVLDVAGSSANHLAAKLYSSTFRGLLVNSTLAATGAGEGPVVVGAVTFHPEAFVPLLPTTTRTLTSTATSTATATATSTSTSTEASTSVGLRSSPAVDGPQHLQADAGSSGPAWWWFVVGAAVAGGAVAAAALAIQRRKQKDVEVTGSQV